MKPQCMLVCEHNVKEDISTADAAVISKTGSEI